MTIDHPELTNSENIRIKDDDKSWFNQIKLYKRPLLHFNKEYNDIYITNKVPLCVYYKRAIQLLRWRLSDLFSLAEKEFISKNNINPKTGSIANKNGITLEYTRQYLHSNSVLYSADARISPKKKCDGALSIYAAGSCITRALYLLQDIFDYVRCVYLEGEAKLNGKVTNIVCEGCRRATEPKFLKESKENTNNSNCKSCKKLVNGYLEDMIRRIIDVSVDTGSIKCVDDVWKFESFEENLETFPKFDLFSSSGAKVTTFERQRIISSIKIAINIPTCLD
ncbi:conserved hypothetical protein [Theileria equi strain WA]|uniref:Uncharacterized protein n=1 Tax=Theileria equi strain WA TaxID=1537102 RepID=L1LG40_THEEQ|nr:conserved hypothetical protein [Theileria equi strain WA]EKX74311.1 conserved hypothetical protein [Theileria equi strain WA]|eukprot:XP_004833763.1 conserved hypothetical protein [Theileria equi strain WA]